ncbi:MAG: hypothetical protein H3C34_02660 [Caldilineaceae bacterium]|nr:hypothetical protein [Caldilineaceae bacterium]
MIQRMLRLLARTILLLVLLAMPASLWAHGGGTPQLTDVTAGPYRLFAWTNPEPWRVGEVHLTVAVTLPTAEGSAVPVSDAQVQVTLQPLAGQQAETLILAGREQGGAGAGFYEADADLPAAGPWEVEIQVSGPDGSGDARFTIEAQTATTLNWTSIGAIVLVASVILALVATRRRQSTRQA